jgi:hypothetical protein
VVAGVTCFLNRQMASEFEVLAQKAPIEEFKEEFY